VASIVGAPRWTLAPYAPTRLPHLVLFGHGAMSDLNPECINADIGRPLPAAGPGGRRVAFPTGRHCWSAALRRVNIIPVLLGCISSGGETGAARIRNRIGKNAKQKYCRTDPDQDGSLFLGSGPFLCWSTRHQKPLMDRSIFDNPLRTQLFHPAPFSGGKRRPSSRGLILLPVAPRHACTTFNGATVSLGDGLLPV
jgi:hypothetical protein